MSQRRHVVGHAFWALFSLFLTAVLIVAVIYIYVEWQLPPVDTLKEATLQVPLRIYTADHRLIAQYGTKRRIPVTLAQVPPLLINAVLATEDARFYEHRGIDFIGLLRALKVMIASGKPSQGASTITMQVARNFFLTSKKTYSRKINEMLLALKIEKELSKEKILELYFNKIYFGNRAYGVAAAATVYYGKTLDQLTLPQMAMIAGLPQAPSRKNPVTNPEEALKRRNHVLKRMLDVGFITVTQYQEAVQTPLTAYYHSATVEVHAPYVAEMVRQVMVDQYGNDAYEKGLTVYTTLSASLQTKANEALRDGLMAYDQRHGFRKPTENLGNHDRVAWLQALQQQPVIQALYPAVVLSVSDHSIRALLADDREITIDWPGLSWARPRMGEGYVGAWPQQASDIVKIGDVVRVMFMPNGEWRLTQIPEVEGAIIVLNPQDGALLALSGGFDYQLSSFNRATQAERQPGSNFKPFIYSAALAKGYTLASVISDAPVVMEDTGENSLWRPTNDTRKFYGPTPLRIGLIQSRNLVSIRLLQAIGITYTLDYVERFGFDANALPHSLSLALGSGVVTPLQIATGYAVFANGGYQITPYFIQTVEDQHHQVLLTTNPPKACEMCITQPQLPLTDLPNPKADRVITAQNAYLITQALRDVIRHGTGQAARSLHRDDLAGKTGTTNDQADAWFSGFNSHMVTTVWIGFDNLKSLREYGAEAALPIWMQFMQTALQDVPEVTMPQPPGIVMVRIDPKTGLLASPNQTNAQFELFQEQNVPKTYSTHTTTTEDDTASGTSPDHEAIPIEDGRLF
ncbi:MAG: peptidase [Gammaproteobacteria bacterium RIFCSPHIGHO2_12_FULL_41_15]|nr:MAG: peptidase [Gammaproteobacteria bacterium RIFCSPHIGHO2_12_FULL_41_15]